jgi:hypothetical protein
VRYVNVRAKAAEERGAAQVGAGHRARLSAHTKFDLVFDTSDAEASERNRPLFSDHSNASIPAAQEWPRSWAVLVRPGPPIEARDPRGCHELEDSHTAIPDLRCSECESAPKVAIQCSFIKQPIDLVA